MKASLQPRLPAAWVIELCSSLTSLFNGLFSFISVGLSKFMNEVEASAAYGENNVYGENNGSSGWVTIGTAGILPASHWNLREFYTHFHVKK